MLLPRLYAEHYNVTQPGEWEKNLASGSLMSKDLWGDEGGTGDRAIGGQMAQLDVTTNEKGRLKFYQEDKPEDKSLEEDSDIATMGISSEGAGLGGRALAMYRLDQLLKLDIIVQTEYAVHERTPEGTGKGVGSEDRVAKMGIAMEAAKGIEAQKAIETGFQMVGKGSQRTIHKEIALDDPVLQQGLNKLQMLDALVGQIDRNQGNYFIQKDPVTGNVIGFKGIDNDLSFDSVLTSEDSGDVANPLERGLKQYRGLPPIVDKAFADMLLRINPIQVEEAVAGLIAPNEIATLLERLRIIKHALNEMPPEVFITDWGAGDIVDRHGESEESYSGHLKKQFEANAGKRALIEAGFKAAHEAVVGPTSEKQIDAFLGNASTLLERPVNSGYMTKDQFLSLAGQLPALMLQDGIEWRPAAQKLLVGFRLNTPEARTIVVALKEGSFKGDVEETALIIFGNLAMVGGYAKWSMEVAIGAARKLDDTIEKAGGYDKVNLNNEIGYTGKLVEQTGSPTHDAIENALRDGGFNRSERIYVGLKSTIHDTVDKNQITMEEALEIAGKFETLINPYNVPDQQIITSFYAIKGAWKKGAEAINKAIGTAEQKWLEADYRGEMESIMEVNGHPLEYGGDRNYFSENLWKAAEKGEIEKDWAIELSESVQTIMGPHDVPYNIRSRVISAIVEMWVQKNSVEDISDMITGRVEEYNASL